MDDIYLSEYAWSVLAVLDREDFKYSPGRVTGVTAQDHGGQVQGGLERGGEWVPVLGHLYRFSTPL